MSLPPLSLISAGAGSGKTYHIERTLGRWINAGDVAPDRIVAVTFTKSAASELRERLRAELVRSNLLNEALLLDQSYISTIHGFGFQLISEFAFEAATSPKQRRLGDDEETALIRQAIAKTDKTEQVMANLPRFGFVYDHGSGMTGEDKFRSQILKLIAKHRSIGWQGEAPEIARHAAAFVKNSYGQTGKASILNESLYRAAHDLLGHFPNDLSVEYGVSQAARNDFRKDFRNLRLAENQERVASDWKMWNDLTKLRQSNSRCKLPEHYDLCAGAVMEAAGALSTHPGPMEDAVIQVNSMFGAAQDTLKVYGEAKRNAALVDYTDMLAMAHVLLKGNADVMTALRERVDCLVIDEFQDTNPLQYALLWAFHEAGVPTLIVGDLKQAIMGFQNADARLMENLLDTYPESASSLDANWRTQASLMKFINRLGPGLFGKSYVDLVPRAPSGFQEPLEVIEYKKRPPRGKGSQEICAAHTALRIKELIDEETQFVRDRKTKVKRRLRGGDVAVLCPRNKQLDIYAKALRAAGLRCQLAEQGWGESRIVEIACHALEYVSDPEDRHAALYMSVTEFGEHSLEGGIKGLIDDGALDGQLLRSLQAVTEKIGAKTVDTIVTEVIDALGLYDRIANWPDAAQSRANLLRLQGEAHEFMSSNREALACGGFHGTGLKTFLAWLKARMKIDDRQPDPRVLDEDAIQLTTWHRAKGREWSVVVVCNWETKVEPRLPDFSVNYQSFGDLSNILENARIEFSPKFAASKTNSQFEKPLRQEVETEALRLIYVALTRARERLILEWPSNLDGKDTVTYYSLLRDATGLALTGDGITVGDQTFSCRMGQAGNSFPDGFDMETTGLSAPLPLIGRRAIEPWTLPDDLTPEARAPSDHDKHEHLETPKNIRRESYGTGLKVELGVTGVERGTLIHKCFEVMGAIQDRPNLLSRATGFELSDDQRDEIVLTFSAFETWRAGYFQDAQVENEVPLIALDDTGTIVAGSIDLLVETEKGFWIIDHKSDRTEDLNVAFTFYLPQLLTYADAVDKARPDKKVLGVGINWISFGEISLLPSCL